MFVNKVEISSETAELRTFLLSMRTIQKAVPLVGVQLSAVVPQYMYNGDVASPIGCRSVGFIKQRLSKDPFRA